MVIQMVPFSFCFIQLSFVLAHFTVVKESEGILFLHNNYNYIAVTGGQAMLILAVKVDFCIFFVECMAWF